MYLSSYSNSKVASVFEAYFLSSIVFKEKEMEHLLEVIKNNNILIS